MKNYFIQIYGCNIVRFFLHRCKLSVPQQLLCGKSISPATIIGTRSSCKVADTTFKEITFRLLTAYLRYITSLTSRNDR